jgi:hypothetical protein
LNIYNFVGITSGVDADCYYHECFRRGHDHLLHQIERIPIKKQFSSITMTRSPQPLDAMNPQIDTMSALSLGLTNMEGTATLGDTLLEGNRFNHFGIDLAGTSSLGLPQRSNQESLSQATENFEAAYTSRRDALLNHSLMRNNMVEPVVPNLSLVHAQNEMTLYHHSNQMATQIHAAELSAVISRLQREQLNLVGSTLPTMMEHGTGCLQQFRLNQLTHLLESEQRAPVSRMTFNSHPFLRDTNHNTVCDLSSSAAGTNQRNEVLQRIVDVRNYELQQHLLQQSATLHLPNVAMGLNNTVSELNRDPISRRYGEGSFLL